MEFIEDKVRVKLELGKTWLKAGSCDKALKILQEARVELESDFQISPQLALKHELTLYLSIAYQKKGDYRTASVLCEEIIAEQPVGTILTEAYRKLGDINFSEGKFREALDNFDKALELDANIGFLVKHDIFYAIGVSCRELDQLDTSIHYLEKAIEAFEPNKGDIEVWQIYLALARTIKRMPVPNVNRGLQCYYKILEILAPFTQQSKHQRTWRKRKSIPQQIAEALLEAYYYIGLFHLYKEEFREAIDCFSKGLSVGSQEQPALANTYFFLGRSYLNEGNNREARKAYQTLLKIDSAHQWSDPAAIYYDIGQTYYKERKYKQALQYRLKILDLEKVDPDLLVDTHLGLGHTYLALNSFAQAAQHYREYLRLSDPKMPERKTAMKYLVYANEVLAKRK